MVCYFSLQWCLSCNCEVSEDHNCPTDITNNTGFNKNDYLERLIAAVFEREVLWNSKLPYKLRGASEMKALWLEIDMYLGKCVYIVLLYIHVFAFIYLYICICNYIKLCKILTFLHDS